MPRPQELQIDWSKTAERQQESAYAAAREMALVPGFDVSSLTARDIADDIQEFERMCHDHWARHRDLLFGDQMVNRSSRGIVFVSERMVKYRAWFEWETASLTIVDFSS